MAVLGMALVAGAATTIPDAGAAAIVGYRCGTGPVISDAMLAVPPIPEASLQLDGVPPGLRSQVRALGTWGQRDWYLAGDPDDRRGIQYLSTPLGSPAIDTSGMCRLRRADDLGGIAMGVSLAVKPTRTARTLDLWVKPWLCGQSKVGWFDKVETPTEVRIITFAVDNPLAETCQARPARRYRIRLDAPLGRRVVIDAGIRPTEPMKVHGRNGPWVF